MMDYYRYIYCISILNFEFLYIGYYVLGLIPPKKIRIIPTIVITAAVGCGMLYIGVGNSIVDLAWCLLIYIIFYNVRILTALKYAALTCMFLSVIDIMIWMIIYVIPAGDGGVVSDIAKGAAVYLPGMIGAVLVIAVGIIAGKKSFRFSEYLKYMSGKESALMIITLLMDLFLTSLMQGVYFDEMTPNLKKWMVIICVVTMFMTMAAFVYLGVILRYNDFVNRIRKNEEAYFKTLNDNYESLRKFKHDSKEHYQAIAALLTNDEVIKAKEYILKIEENSGLWSMLTLGDSLVDAMFASVFEEYTGSGGWDITIRGRMNNRIHMDEFDKCVLFSNIFRNCKEAMEKSDAKELTIDILEGEDETCIIVTNSKVEGIADLSRSDKKEKNLHGIGITNIKDVIKKNHGEIEWKDIGIKMEVKMYIPSTKGKI